jgi:heavy metal sensor kinase
MTKSIRWTLLLGHALILGGVMASFGGLLYFRVRDSTLGAVDAELSAQAQALAESMQAISGDRFELTLSESQSRYFNTTGFFVIWSNKGVVDFSDPQFADLPPYKGSPRLRRDLRDVTVEGPGGSRIVVGRSIRLEQHRLKELLSIILGIGAFAFAAGWVGGRLLIGRILNPIRRITRTAASISESNLSSRIDTAVTENELGDLARTLNSAFDRLEAAMVRQNRFTADASHELRTPLSVLMTQMELALRKERAPSEYREVLEVCLKAVRRMTSLGEGLLFLARADAKSVELRREPLDLKEVVEEAVGFARPMAESRGVHLSVTAESHRMVGDRDRLGEAVTNLVANAILYNRPQGRVEVTLKEGLLAVSDTGPGIPEEDRPHIFERFYRADQARSRNTGGAGLGLAITKWITEAHGGAIDFTCGAGGGTTFQVRFQPAELYSQKRT